MTAPTRPTNAAFLDGGGFTHRLHNQLVERIRRDVAEWVEGERADGRTPDHDDRRAYAETVCAAFFTEQSNSRIEHDEPQLGHREEMELRDAAIRSAFGTPWEAHLDPIYSDVFINGPDQVFAVVRATGAKVPLPPVARTSEELIEQIKFVANHGGRTARRFDEANPTLNLRLNNGARLHAVMAGITNKTHVSIRIHSAELSRLRALEEAGMIDATMVRFLRAAVRAKKTFIITGATGAGKTTLARALLNEIGPEERLATVEDDMELALSDFDDLHPDLIEYEARLPNIEGEGAFTMADCLRECLRQNPSRVIVGEIRGAEIFSFLLAITNGRTGSLCTVHAASTAEVFDRLAMYLEMSPEGKGLSRDGMMRLVGSAVDFVVHVENRDGRRAVSSIRQVVQVGDQGQMETLELWSSDPLGDDPGAFPTGLVPTSPMASHLRKHGFDPADLNNRNGVRVEPAALNGAGR